MPELTHPFPSAFPVETEENIIDQLFDCAPALRQCALTCRAWVPRSRFYLLRSVSIKTLEQFLAFLDVLKTYPIRSSWITSVTMAPLARETHSRSLMEAFPGALLLNTPNLRRWEINQAAMRRTTARDTLVFHDKALGRLRRSSIEELHLCSIESIQLRSHGELIRLLNSFTRLHSLRCTSVGFAEVEPVSLDPQKATARRRLAMLSTLTVDDMAKKVIFLLLEVFKDILPALHICHIKATHREAIPLPRPSSLPLGLTMTRLSSITLNWRTKEDADLDDALPAFFKSASDLTWEQLRWAPNRRSIAIQLHHDHLPHEPRWSPKWYTSLLRRPGVSESVRQQYLALERALAKLRMRHNVALYLSEWSENASSMLRRRLENILDGVSEFPIEVHGGMGLRSEMGHQGPVIALAASPDGKWIASGGRDGCVYLWDTEHPCQRIAFPVLSLAVNGADLETFHIRRMNALGAPAAELAQPPRPDGAALTGLFSRRCAWFPDGSKFTTVAFRRGDSIPVFAYVWDTRTYALLQTIRYDPNPHPPSGSKVGQGPSPPPKAPLVDCFLDGHQPVVIWFNPEVSLDDINAGTQFTVQTGYQPHLRWSGTVTVTFPNPSSYEVTFFYGSSVGRWALQGPGRAPSLLHLEEHTSSLFSPDGGRRLSWSDRWFRIWDAHSGRCSATFHRANVFGGCFSPDGAHVAVCSEEDGREGLLQVGRISDGGLLGTFEYKRLPVGSAVRNERVVAFAGDGNAVYLGTPTGDVRMYPLPEPDAMHDDYDDEETVRWQRWDED